jgi:hypothetical protein
VLSQSVELVWKPRDTLVAIVLRQSLCFAGNHAPGRDRTHTTGILLVAAARTDQLFGCFFALHMSPGSYSPSSATLFTTTSSTKRDVLIVSYIKSAPDFESRDATQCTS